jgi:hypothetical protein
VTDPTSKFNISVTNGDSGSRFEVPETTIYGTVFGEGMAMIRQQVEFWQHFEKCRILNFFEFICHARVIYQKICIFMRIQRLKSKIVSDYTTILLYP